MAILTSEVKTYRSLVINATTTNGGRIDDSALVVDNVTNNAFPDLSTTNLTDGETLWRKLFSRMEDSENGDLANAGHYIYQPSTGDTEFYLAEGDQTDTQGSMFSSDLFGVGTLDANVTAGDSSIDVAVKDGTVTQFRNGDTIRIHDGTNFEYLALTAIPSVAGDVVTLTVGSGLPANSYSTSNTFVAAVVDYGTVTTSVSGVVETSSAGTFDEASVVVPNTGAVYQSWTLTFSSSTAFDAVGDTLGSAGSGNVSSTFAPTNPNTSTAYFSIPSAVWGGTWAAAETVVFVTNPATMAPWVKRLTPAGSSSSSGQNCDLRGKGESSA